MQKHGYYNDKSHSIYAITIYTKSVRKYLNFLWTISATNSWVTFLPYKKDVQTCILYIISINPTLCSLGIKTPWKAISDLLNLSSKGYVSLQPAQDDPKKPQISKHSSVFANASMSRIFEHVRRSRTPPLSLMARESPHNFTTTRHWATFSGSHNRNFSRRTQHVARISIIYWQIYYYLFRTALPTIAQNRVPRSENKKKNDHIKIHSRASYSRRVELSWHSFLLHVLYVNNK